jgi:hypothetical protein
MTADGELLKPQSISHLRHVVRPVQQPPILLKIRRTASGPVDRNDTHSEFTGYVIIRTKVESRTDPTVEEEDGTPFAISILLIPDLPAVRKLHIARIKHKDSSLHTRSRSRFHRAHIGTYAPPARPTYCRRLWAVGIRSLLVLGLPFTFLIQDRCQHEQQPASA